MKTYIHNKNNINENEINGIQIRVKALIESDNEILICNTNNVLHFPGGHVYKNESFKKALIREILEETGIMFKYRNIKKPAIKIVSYDKDYPKEGLNTKDITFYYFIKTNKKVNENNIKLTLYEKEKCFKIESINVNKVKDYIKKNIINNKLNEIISPDMILVIDEYLNN